MALLCPCVLEKLARMRCPSGVSETTTTLKAARATSVTSETIRPRIASRTVTYSTPIPRLRNMPRLSENVIGTIEAMSTQMTTFRHVPRRVLAIVAKATGVSTAIVPPQRFVYGKGAAGRGIGNPRNACTCAKTG